MRKICIIPAIAILLAAASGCAKETSITQEVNDASVDRHLIIETRIPEKENEGNSSKAEKSCDAEGAKSTTEKLQDKNSKAESDRTTTDAEHKVNDEDIINAFPDEDKQINVTFTANGKSTSLILPMNYTANIYGASPENEKYVNRAFSTEVVTLSKLPELNSDILIKRVDLSYEGQYYSISALPEDIIDTIEIEAEESEGAGVRTFNESTDNETRYKAIIDEDEMGCAVYVRYKCSTDRHASFENWTNDLSKRITN